MTSSRQCLTVKPLVQFQRMLEPTCVGLDPRTPSPSGWRTVAEIVSVGFSPLAVFFLTTRQVDFDAESAALAAAARMRTTNTAAIRTSVEPDLCTSICDGYNDLQ